MAAIPALTEQQMYVLERLDGHLADLDPDGSARVPQTAIFDGFMQEFQADVMPVLEDLVLAKAWVEKAEGSNVMFYISPRGQQVLDMVRRKAKPSEQPATSPALVRAASARRDRAAKAPKADAATE